MRGIGAAAPAREPVLGVLLGGLGRAQRTLLLAQVAGDLLIEAEASEHGEGEDGDDDEHQKRRHEHHAALRLSLRAHVITPVRFITSMVRMN